MCGRQYFPGSLGLLRLGRILLMWIASFIPLFRKFGSLSMMEIVTCDLVWLDSAMWADTSVVPKERAWSDPVARDL